MSGEYLGDFVGDETFPIYFDTFDSNGASVTLTGLAVTDIEIYKGSSMTQRASDAGYTLIDTDGIDVDTTTGLHGFTVDLSDNTDAGFYATGNDYIVLVNSVTIDSQTVTFIAARFSIQNRYASKNLAGSVWDITQSSHLTAGTTGLYMALAGAVFVDTTVTGTPTSTTFQLTAGSAIDDFYNDQLIYVLSGTGVGQARPILDYTGATKTVTIDEAWVTTPAAADRVAILSAHEHPLSQIVDSVWDEALTKATHNVAQSAGKRLRQIDAAFEVHSGTAQAGAAGTITLDTGASATDEIYRGDRIIIVDGTGAQEHGIITAYNGTTKVATMAENWVITPDATSEFEVVPADVDVETWQHTGTTTGATSGYPVVDAQAISDSTTAADNTESIAADWLNGGRLDLILDIIAADTTTDIPALLTTIDTIVDAIKAKTDSLTFTQANEVDANVQSINDVAITGDGSTTPFDV